MVYLILAYSIVSRQNCSRSTSVARYNLSNLLIAGVEFGARMINIDGKQIKLQIWDTVRSTFKDTPFLLHFSTLYVIIHLCYCLLFGLEQLHTLDACYVILY